VGFILGLTLGSDHACAYVTPQDRVACADAFPSTTSFSITGLGIGNTSFRDAQALVTITGRFCTTEGGTTTCATNTSLHAGQPRNDSAAAFAAAYHPSQPASIGKRAIPCQRIDNQWYVDLGA
jgi:hypothetical protein